jgi:PncC family amidohydrolase
LIDIANQVVQLLAQRELKLALAESCTGGLVAAELAKVPGVSDWFCGSAVTYRSETKSAWLGVDPNVIQQFTAVSSEVSAQMVDGVLRTTPEADIAAAITGHLGPLAPEGFDGLVFVASANRNDTDPNVTRHQLKTTTRVLRQSEAANLVLRELMAQIK